MANPEHPFKPEIKPPEKPRRQKFDIPLPQPSTDSKLKFQPPSEREKEELEKGIVDLSEVAKKIAAGEKPKEKKVRF